MNAPINIDELELQRLLDGSLPAEDRSLLLSQAAEHPHWWRTIALAFVEEQVFQNEFAKSFSINSHPVNPVKVSPPKPDSPSRWRMTKRLVQAAMLLATLCMGISLDRTLVAWQAPEAAPVQPEKSYTLVMIPEADHSLPTAFDPSANQLNETLLATGSMLDPVLNQATRDAFRNHGYEFSEEPVIYVVDGHQGEQYVVPRRSVSLVNHRDD